MLANTNPLVPESTLSAEEKLAAAEAQERAKQAAIAKWELKKAALAPKFSEVLPPGELLSRERKKADELWFSGTWPHAESSENLDLSGLGETVGVWEVDGGINLNHIEFGSNRVFQKDTTAPAVDATGHATAVTGIIAGAGGFDLPFIPSTYNEARGVAYRSNIFGYDTDDIAMERSDAAAGNGIDPPVRIANHSWGIPGPWEIFDNDPLPPDGPGEDLDGDGVTDEDNVDLQWRWTSFSNPAVQEAPRFGFYFPSNPAQIGGLDWDKFMHSTATRHLCIFACGNDRLGGPGTKPARYFIDGVEKDPDLEPRDWANGDEGGYDTVASPGTAKNVLTVGSCQDVYHEPIPGTIVAGFGPNAVVIPSDFSGAGPTDDGRIKPDVVAPGSVSEIAREEFEMGIFVPNPNPAGDDIFVPYLVAPNDDSAGSYLLRFEGTSSAAPTVSGLVALVLQRRAQLYPTLPESEDYHGSTLKALIINSADDVNAPGPDYRMGHGPANARSAVKSIDADHAAGRGSLIKEVTLDPTESVSWVVHSDGLSEFAATLAWSDTEGPAPTQFTIPESQAPMLVNNLDLKVEYLGSKLSSFPPGPVVSTFLPWVLNPDLTGETAALRSAPAQRGLDDRNNVEKVSIASPLAGRYLITVTHSGGLPANPAASPQIASIVLAGVTSEAPRISSLEVSPTANEFILTFAVDPGSWCTIQSSDDLQTWTDLGSTLATESSNTRLVTTLATQSRKFWRVRRGQ